MRTNNEKFNKPVNDSERQKSENKNKTNKLFRIFHDTDSTTFVRSGKAFRNWIHK